jgi:hypothetical protein
MAFGSRLAAYSWSYGRFLARKLRLGIPTDWCLQSSHTQLGVELQELVLSDRQPTDDHVLGSLQLPSVYFDRHDLSLRF